MRGRSSQECCSSQRRTFLTSQGLPTSEPARVMLLDLWWNLPERAGGTCTAQNTWKDIQGLQGNSAESSLHQSLGKPVQTFRNPFGIADWLTTSPGLQGRALLQTGKVTVLSPEGRAVLLSFSNDSDCSEVVGAGYSILAKICDIPYTAVML